MNGDVQKGSEEIDPAASREFAAIGRDMARHLKGMRQAAIFSDGALPARCKALAAALWSVSARCEPCAGFYLRKAQELGASHAEITEMLAIASVMGGCVGETWALKARAAVREGSSEDDCCET